jgi:excisionase family DNA binding protein
MTSEAPPRTRGHWLTAEQLAAELQISPRHLARLREAGLPCVQLGTAVRFNAEEVEAYLRDHRRLAAEGGCRP